MNQIFDRLRAVPRALVALVVLALVGAIFVVTRPGDDTRTVTAYFSRAVSLYPGSEVRILGVNVGEVISIVPAGNAVRVEMEYDAEYPLPADAKAVIVTPTLTADRFVQLTPAYSSGPQMPDDAEIAVEDTGSPVELDRIYRSLSDLTKALGPNGVNRNGTLDNVLEAGAQFLDGQGRKANTTIVNLSRALKTFGEGSGELFETVRGLNAFTGALAENDAAVDAFMGNLAAVSTQLAAEKDELFGALQNLASVLGKVERFVKDNRQALTTNVENLTTVLTEVANERAALETVLEVGPVAMGNLVTAWEPYTGTIGSRINLGPNVATVDDLLCSIVGVGGAGLSDAACALFKQLLAPLRNDGQAPVAGRPATGTQQRKAAVEPASFGPLSGADDLGQLLGGGDGS